MTNFQLDELDRAIIAKLDIDARASARAIAISLGTAEGTIRTRIRRLLETKAIRVAGVTNLAQQENLVLALIWIRFDRAVEAREVTERIAALDQIVFLSTMIGVADLLAMIFVKDAAALSDFVHGTLDLIPGVRNVEYALSRYVAKDDFRFQAFPGFNEE
jgi:Lrp/AsnC family transcriptional regulator for asnA, asnC and gidA